MKTHHFKAMALAALAMLLAGTAQVQAQSLRDRGGAYIGKIDSESGRPHTVIGIQVENEPDMLASRHFGMVGQSTANLWPGILHHLDVIGKAVKQSSYDCYTRVNITLDEDFQKWGAMVFKREGIDYLGLDPEFAYSYSPLMQGVDFAKATAPRSVKFGVNLKF